MTLRTEWTEDRVKQLTRLAREGLTGTQIAKLMGTSRCAIMGKCHRIGVQLGAGETSGKRSAAARKGLRRSNPARKPAPAPRQSEAPVIAFPPVVEAMELVEATILLEAEETPPHGLQLIDLQNHHCRWPINDPGSSDFHFCGKVANLAAGRPYCEFHASQAKAHVYTRSEREEYRAAKRQSAFTKVEL